MQSARPRGSRPSRQRRGGAARGGHAPQEFGVRGGRSSAHPAEFRNGAQNTRHVFEIASDLYHFVIDCCMISGSIFKGFWFPFRSGTLLQAALGSEVGAEKLRTGTQIDFWWILGPSWGPFRCFWNSFSDIFDAQVESFRKLSSKPLPGRLQD